MDHIHRSGFRSAAYDGITHVKTLPYLSIVQAVEGNYDIQLGKGAMHNTGVKGFFVAPANMQQTIVHHGDPTSRQMTCRWIFLKVTVNNVYSLDDVYDFPVVLPDAHKEQMGRLFDRLFSAEDIFNEYVCYYEIVQLLCKIAREKSRKFPPHLDQALAYITDHFRSKIAVRDIAEAVHLSESRLFSVFKQALGVSPITYLNNYRLSLAAEELVASNKTITEIADAIGIDDPVYFNKLFRKSFQMSPSKYRALHKNDNP